MPMPDLKRNVATLLLGIACGSAAVVLAWHQSGGGCSVIRRAGINVPIERLRSQLALELVPPSRVEISQMSLLCAEGLPGGPDGDTGGLYARLEEWTTQVGAEPARNLHRFRENPAEFHHSEAYFRILVLVTVLQQDCGVRYNPERVQAPDFSDSRDLFLHGLLSGQRQGTCVSIPVLYVAIGRLLGYPLKLVATKAHLFARWESADGKERFNIEATNQGLNTFPDEYYHTWPLPLTPAELAGGQYLKSLTPAEELAVFLTTRGHCLKTLGRLEEAAVCYAHAHLLAPQSELHLASLAAVVSQQMPNWQRVRVDLGKNEMDHNKTRPN